ncbi:Peptidase inhibitor 16 [Trichinella pseudospiralis]|uniref:Peptidase inhibitor 16 n=1 Tax=Trichinella pseudospiralis TaxID=6337 RepID=A0A0V0Y159_TRIPS|nr:Peptidase inhibitor 16 [Trichinella pseudospiralis]
MLTSLVALLFTTFHLCHSQATPVQLQAQFQQNIVKRANFFRGLVEGTFIQCLRKIDSTLIAYADEIAKTCDMERKNDFKHGISFFFQNTMPSADDIITGIWNEGSLDYKHNENTCTAGQRCDNYKQLLWYEAEGIGCSVAKCNAVKNILPGKAAEEGYLAVCAFTIRADVSRQPFQAGRPCNPCPQALSVCSSNLCCSSQLDDIYKSDAFSVSSASVGCAAKPTNLAKLTRLWNNRISSNVLVASETDLQTAQRQGGNIIGVIGEVATAPSSSCPHLRPIYHLYTNHFSSDYYLVDELVMTRRVQEGYRNLGVIGYAVRGPALCGATVPVYTFFHNPSGFVQLQNGSDVSSLLTGRYGRHDYQGVEFYIWSSPPATSTPSCGSLPGNLVSLTRLYHNTRTTNMLVVDAAAVQNEINKGAQTMGVIGKIGKEMQANCPHMKPIRHLYSDYFTMDYYIVDDLLVAQRLRDGYRDLGTIGYAVSGPNLCGSSIPIYEFFHPRLGMLQLQNSTEVTNLLGGSKGHVFFQGVSFYIWA